MGQEGVCAHWWLFWILNYWVGINREEYTWPLPLISTIRYYHTIVKYQKKSQFLKILFLELHQNSDFYKNADVRPPFTYASLIRQVKICNFRSKTNFSISKMNIFNRKYPFWMSNTSLNRRKCIIFNINYFIFVKINLIWCIYIYMHLFER